MYLKEKQNAPGEKKSFRLALAQQYKPNREHRTE